MSTFVTIAMSTSLIAMNASPMKAKLIKLQRQISEYEQSKLSQIHQDLPNNQKQNA